MSPFDRLSHDPQRAALIVIALFALLRVAFAALLDFGIDESYTLGQARDVALSYFDHPPAHIWLAHASMAIFGTTWAVRLPFIALFALASWLLFRITRRLFGATAGLWAVFALSASPFFLAAAGTWVLPDGPLLAALAGGMRALARLFFPRHDERERPWRDWLLAGACFGLAGLSKYSAVLVIAGLLIFIAGVPRERRWLTHPAPYLGAALAFALVSPVFLWNMANGWASFGFQTGRATGQGLTPTAFAQMLVGQFVWLGPWIAVPLTLATIAAIPKAVDPRRVFCLALALPTILVFTLQSLWSGSAYPHWPMPGWFFAFPLLGLWLVENTTRRPSPEAWATASAALAVLLALGFGLIAASGGLTRLGLPPRADPTIDVLRWDAIRAPLREAGVGRPDGPVIVASRWLEGGKIDLALGGEAIVLVAGPDPRGFGTRRDQTVYLGREAILVVTRQAFERDLARLEPLFEAFRPSRPVFVGRDGRPEIEILLVPAGRLKALR